MAAIRGVTREGRATLLVVDGATVVQDAATSPLALRRFAQQHEGCGPDGVEQRVEIAGRAR